MKRIDRDYVPHFLITACLVIWLSSKPWASSDAAAIAGDIVKVCFGGILGYLAKDVIRRPQAEASETGDNAMVDNLLAENQKLIDELNALKQVNGL